MSSITVQFKRGPHEKIMSYLGAEGELIVDLDEKKLRLMDGKTPGGFIVCNAVLSSSHELISFDMYAGRFVGKFVQTPSGQLLTMGDE